MVQEETMGECLRKRPSLELERQLTMRNEQQEIQNATISYDPQPETRTRKWRKVFLITPAGRIYRGIKVNTGNALRPELDIPFLLTLHNRPELGEHEVSLPETTKEVLRHKIIDKLFSPSRNVWQ